jgi:hypothetical protein
MAQEGSAGEQRPVGFGKHCPFCNQWFFSTEYLEHMDMELDLINLNKAEAAKNVSSS